MTDYARLRMIVETSEHSDYHQPLRQEMVYEPTPAEWQVMKLDVVVGGTTVELGNYTTVTVCVVENVDTTNFVEITHTYDGTSVVTYLPPGAFTMIYNPTAANDLVLTADTATCVCRIWVAGT
jgi:hypothetical protein